MRLLGLRRGTDERLLWTRDKRLVGRLVKVIPGCRVVEIESGWCVVGPASELTDTRVAPIAGDVAFGTALVDASTATSDRLVVALGKAVQASGIADRIGMDQTPYIVQTKLLDLFFALRNASVVFQPIVDLRSGEAWEYELLSRPGPMRPQPTVTEIVESAIATGRQVEVDRFFLERIAARLVELRDSGARLPHHVAINLTPTSLLDERMTARALADAVATAGLAPRQVTIEVTEQQAVPDVVPLKRQVKALRRIGFDFAVDDAGAGYASFANIAGLRPSTIKIDRDIVHGVHADDAKQALIEAFVSFARRIGARLVAEGIETRKDMAMLIDLGVELGQGYLLGRPSALPTRPRRIDVQRLDAARATFARGMSAAASGLSGVAAAGTTRRTTDPAAS